MSDPRASVVEQPVSRVCAGWLQAGDRSADRHEARCDGVIRVPANTATGQRHPAGAAPDPSRWAPRIALGAVCLGFFVIQLDVTIVNVALPTIQRDVGGTVAGLQWILDAYTLAMAAFMLTAGATADRI